MIHITENAAKQMLLLVAEKAVGLDGGLRLSIEKGGCAGLQYEMEICAPQAEDRTFEAFGAKLFVPQDSLERLDESTIDYEDGLSGAGFRIINPHAARSCGCGTSFEPANTASSAAGSAA